MELGVISFGVLTILTLVLFGVTLHKGSWYPRFPRWRYSLFVISFVGLMVNVEADTYLYWILGFSLVTTAALNAVPAQPTEGWRYVGWSAIAALAAFVLPALAFAFQPAPPFAALWVVIPGVLLTYTPWGQRLCRRVDAAIREKIQQDAGIRERSRRRAEWRARR